MEEKILRQFRKHPDKFLSGEDISKHLDISRAAVWKHIERLRLLGYEFDAVPHLGYRLRGVPDILYPQEIKNGLKTTFFAKDIYHHDKIDSTNTAAYSLAEDGAKEGTLVVAESQTKGRGRLLRSWSSPKGKGIYASVILRPRITPFQAPGITLTAAVSIAQAIREYTEAPALIKWPNDILLNGRKIGGVLTEMAAEQDYTSFIILGFGINVNTKISQLPKGAGSISEALKSEVSRIELFKTLLVRLEQCYIEFTKKGFSANTKQWCDLSATLGKRIRATCMHKTIEGEAIGLDPAGALLVRPDNGSVEKIFAGDIALLR